MKKIIALFCAVLFSGCLMAQMPFFRNQFTTNVPGAYVRGNVAFGDSFTWFVVNGPFTNASGNAYFGGGTTRFADGIFVELPSVFKQGLSATGSVIVAGFGLGTNWIVNPPLWDDVRIPVGTLTSPASVPGRVTVAAGANNISSYGFDAGTDEMLSFELQVPHGINTNNTYGVRVHIHYTGLVQPTQNSNIVWGLDYMVANPSSRFNTVPLTIYATNGLTGTTNHMIAAFFYPITNITESAVVFGTLFRDANNPSDVYSGDAIALSLDAHYVRRQMGSHAEYGDF